MKSFFGSFFGALAAIILLFGFCVLGLIAVIVIAGSSKKAVVVPAGSLLVLDLAVPIRDTPPEFNPGQLFAGITDEQQEERVSLREVLQAVNRAATDSNIR